MSPSGPIELATVRQSVAHLISTQGQRRAVAELAVDGALIQSTLFQHRLHRGHRFSRRCSKPWPVRFRDLRPGDEDRKSGPDGRVVEYFGHILVPQRDASGCPVAGDSQAVNLYFTPDGAGRFDDASLNRQLMTNGVDRSGVVQIESFEVGRIRL